MRLRRARFIRNFLCGLTLDSRSRPAILAPVTTFDLYTPEEVIDSHPEFADMDNPNGYIYGFGIYLRATNELGQRWLGAKVGGCRDLRGVDLFLRTWERPLERMSAHGLSAAQKARQQEKALFDLLLNRKKNR